MRERILITGSSGLVGRALRAALEASGIEVRAFDLRGEGIDHGDVRDAQQVEQAVAGCIGVVHLAALSRVAQAEKEPEHCWQVNVEGVRNVVDAVERAPEAPWMIFASSREVYGQTDRLPATEDSPLLPMNVYGRAKVAGERLVAELRRRRSTAAVVRLSNVYGSTVDHADRVVPAFVRAAILGAPLRVEGADNTFDFTHLDDVVAGLVAQIAKLRRGEATAEPMHLVSGKGTSLLELAEMTIASAGSRSIIRHAAPRTFDVSRFYGAPERAYAELDWRPRTSLRRGLARLITELRDELGIETSGESVPTEA